jgi:hypothetical protein
VPNKPKPWPYNAKGARDKAAEAAVASLLALRPLITGRQITDPEVLKCLAVINHNQGFIINTLQAVGAQVTVDQDFWTMPIGVTHGRQCN